MVTKKANRSRPSVGGALRIARYTRRDLLRTALLTGVLAACSASKKESKTSPGANSGGQPTKPAAAGSQSASFGSTAVLPAAVGSGLSVFPIPNASTASPGTEVSFRGLSGNELGTIEITASESGGHTGRLLPHADGQGASFVPDAPFHPGEQVTVIANPDPSVGGQLRFQFTVAHLLPETAPSDRVINDRGKDIQTFHSRPDLRPPAVEVGTPSADTAPGYIFLAPKDNPGQYGAMILDNKGELVWFHLLDTDAEEVTNLQVQNYQGEPRLIWWEGLSKQGHGLGHYVIADDSYQPVATVRAGNGLTGDLHEFQITPQDTALFTVYAFVSWDLSSVGGPKDGVVVDGIAQEVEIETGRVLFEWHSLDHVGLDESYLKPSKSGDPFDYFHINAIDLDEDGNFVISARHTWTIYKIDHYTGKVVWRLNGKKSDFEVAESVRTAWQHDVRMHSGGQISIFDNGWDGTSRLKHHQSRGLVLQLHTTDMRALLVKEYTLPHKPLSGREGNMQMLPNSNVFMGWGNLPIYSEFDHDGKLIYEAQFLPHKCESYRAYRCQWRGYPTDDPALVVEGADGDRAMAYVSWNGATEVASWELLEGSNEDELRGVRSIACDGFETAIELSNPQLYVAVRARDSSGNVLGTSRTARQGS